MGDVLSRPWGAKAEARPEFVRRWTVGIGTVVYLPTSKQWVETHPDGDTCRTVWYDIPNKKGTIVRCYDAEGELHSYDRPAVIIDGWDLKRKMWFRHGLLHRDPKGPAVEELVYPFYGEVTRVYWVNGVQVPPPGEGKPAAKRRYSSTASGSTTSSRGSTGSSGDDSTCSSAT